MARLELSLYLLAFRVLLCPHVLGAEIFVALLEWVVGTR